MTFVVLFNGHGAATRGIPFLPCIQIKQNDFLECNYILKIKI